VIGVSSSRLLVAAFLVSACGSRLLPSEGHPGRRVPSVAGSSAERTFTVNLLGSAADIPIPMAGIYGSRTCLSATNSPGK